MRTFYSSMASIAKQPTTSSWRKADNRENNWNTLGKKKRTQDRVELLHCEQKNSDKSTKDSMTG